MRKFLSVVLCSLLVALIPTRGRAAPGSGTPYKGMTILVDACVPGASAAASCTDAFTNLGAGFTEAAASSANLWRWELSTRAFNEYNATFKMSVAAVTGDIVIECDQDSTFASATTFATLEPGTSTAVLYNGWLDMTKSGECYGDRVYFRVGMNGGNGTEDPRISFVRIQFK